jgi:hypothetical protein
MSLKARAIALGLAAVSLSAPAAQAWDHQDGTAVTADPTTDIAAVYAWMDPQASRLNMVMTVNPSADKTTAKFSTTALYVFHTMAKASGTDTTNYPEVNVICSFNASQTIECWAGDNDYVTGNASVGNGISNQSGHLQVFAGPRNDPFFFNMSAFNNTVTLIKTALANKAYGTADAAGCYTVPALVVPTVKSSLSTPNKDDFAGKNVLAIVVSIDKSIVTTQQHQIVTVWGSTNKKVM